MKKKAIIILSIILIISIVGSVVTITSAYAAKSDTADAAVSTHKKFDEPMFDVTKVNSKAAASKTVSESNSTKKITYKDSFYYSPEQYVDQYYDSIGTRYAFNQKGEQTEYTISFTKSSEILSEINGGNATVKTKKDITAIANSKLRDILGSAHTDYVLNYYDYSPDTKMYTFGFNKMYGDKAFITGEGFNIYIYETGDIHQWSFMHADVLSEFDTSRLNGITESMLEEYACRQTASKYGYDISDLEAVGFQLVKINGYYAVHVFVGDKNIEGSIVDSDVYYEV